MLRPGNVTAPAGAVGILRRLLMLVRHYLPGARIRVRLDGGFAHPDLLDFLDAEPHLEYVVAMPKNAVLQRFPGQPTPRATDRRGLRADAGAAPQGRKHQLRSRSGLDTARTAVETGRPRAGLGATRGSASARVVPVPAGLPATGDGTRRLAGVAPLRKTLHSHFQCRARESSAKKHSAITLSHTLKAANSALQPTSRRREPLSRNFALQNTTRSPFTNYAG